MKKNIWTLIVEFLRGIGFSIPSPWQASAKKAGFENVNANSLDKLFDYLRFCLEQICADKEMESLLKALDGDYVIPGPGGDPIRNPGVLPSSLCTACSSCTSSSSLGIGLRRTTRSVWKRRERLSEWMRASGRGRAVVRGAGALPSRARARWARNPYAKTGLQTPKGRCVRGWRENPSG